MYRTFRTLLLGATAALALAACSDDNLPEAGMCRALLVDQILEVGQSAQGTLDSRDCLFQGYRAAGWHLAIGEEGRLQVDLASTDFDALLVLTDRAMNILAINHDGGQGLNSRLILSMLPEDYIVWALSWDGSEFGSYQLALQEIDGRSCSEIMGQLGAGETATGELEPQSCLLDGTSLADPWDLTLDEPATLQIDMTTADFDAAVLVTDAEGEVLGYDDDSGEGLNAQLVLELEAGAYTIWATTYWDGDSGQYEIEVVEVEDPEPGA